MSKLTDAISIISGLATLVDGAKQIGIPVSLEVKVGRLTEAVDALAQHISNIIKDDGADDERVQALVLRVAELEERLNGQGITLTDLAVKGNLKTMLEVAPKPKPKPKPKTTATKKAA